MKKALYLSIVCASTLFAAEAELGTIDVESQVDTEVIENVSGEDIKSADVADALMKQSPSVSLVRRSGIANDIIVRGQKKDNINVTIDGAKVYGACPNRMDPPISHVLANNIDYITIDDGPYDIENFGALSADVKVETRKPTKEFSGDVGLNFGSWSYKKASAMASGGFDTVRFLVSISGERGGQYEDGDGNNFYQQVNNYITKNLNGNPEHDKRLETQAYKSQYSDMDAFTKKTAMAKIFWDLTDTQQLRLSYTGNRSDDILYPSTPMDALYDNSNIYNLEYTVRDLGHYSKRLDIQIYKSDVDHPMDNFYRKISNVKPMKNWLTTATRGASIKNRFDLDNHEITVGIDSSLRNWNGAYYGLNDVYKGVSIPDVDTQNIAFFAEDKITLEKFTLNLGLRYDDTSVTPEGMLRENDYNALNGFILGTYALDRKSKIYLGIGRSSRVPDGKELYFQKAGKVLGTPDLDLVTNTEVDLGVKREFENATVEAKLFYSKLGNFIFYNADRMINRYENMDAAIYGFELSGTYIATDSIYFDYGLAYQRGKKDDPLSGQTGTNMPEIPPMKLTAAINYDYDDTANIKAEFVAVHRWDNVDYENGEQVLAGWGIVNLKATKNFFDSLELTLGADNLFDKTYAVSNTYQDLTLISGGVGEVMLMNDPGRYIYANVKYSF
jgi:iron complex outermembrane receptor protein